MHEIKFEKIWVKKEIFDRRNKFILKENIYLIFYFSYIFYYKSFCLRINLFVKILYFLIFLKHRSSKASSKQFYSLFLYENFFNIHKHFQFITRF